MRNTLTRARWFLLGMREYRLSCTANPMDDDLMDCYDRGRDFAHRITFRHWDR